MEVLYFWYFQQRYCLFHSPHLRWGIKIRSHSNVPPENVFMASEFIVLHKALKGIRKSYNHAHEDERPSYQSLMIAINRYLLLARELADCSPHPQSEN